MKGIFIDVEKCEVSQINIKGNLDDFYRLIGCNVITTISCPNSGDHDIIVDDEGLLKEIKGMFSIDDENEPQLAGNGVILRVNEELGKWMASKLTVEEIKRRITFFKLIQTPLGKAIFKVRKE